MICYQSAELNTFLISKMTRILSSIVLHVPKFALLTIATILLTASIVLQPSLNLNWLSDKIMASFNCLSLTVFPLIYQVHVHIGLYFIFSSPAFFPIKTSLLIFHVGGKIPVLARYLTHA